MKVMCTKANPDLLKWTRDESGRSVSDAAKKIKLDKEKYMLLETGNQHPTLRQLKDLAAYYKRPVGIFFLPSAPKSTKKPKDYRAHKGNLSPATLQSIRRARFVQKNYQNLLDGPVGSALWSPESAASKNAEKARAWLELTDEEQIKNRDINSFYKHFIALLENKGISVLQHSFPQEDAKAYSFAEIPRIVVVTTNDNHIGSRIFSILHELCHISHGHSGLCITNDVNNSYTTERQCDKFAAEFLMPRRLVIPVLDTFEGADLLDNDNLRAAAERLKTSMYALLIRLKEFGYIDQADIDKKRAEWKKIPKKKGGFATTTRAQKTVKENGAPFTEAVINAYHSDRITVADASYLLNVNQGYLNEVGEKVSVG